MKVDPATPQPSSLKAQLGARDLVQYQPISIDLGIELQAVLEGIEAVLQDQRDCWLYLPSGRWLNLMLLTLVEHQLNPDGTRHALTAQFVNGQCIILMGDDMPELLSAISKREP